MALGIKIATASVKIYIGPKFLARELLQFLL